MRRVSVIITTHSQERLAIQAVESVLAQALDNVEIIVVGDGPTGDFSDSVRSCETPLVLVRLPHHGLPAALAAAAEAATGDFLCFMNADDWCPPGELEAQVRLLEMRPRLGLTYLGAQSEGDEEREFVKEIEASDDAPPGHLLTLEILLSGCPLIRRHCAECMGLLEPSQYLEADWDPWALMRLAGYELDEREQHLLCKTYLTLFLQKMSQGAIKTARRYFTEAVRVRPELLKKPGIFADAVAEHVADLKIEEPAKYIRPIFHHLPDEAQGLGLFAPLITAKVLIDKASRNYECGNLSQARHDILAGLSHDLSRLRSRDTVVLSLKTFLSRPESISQIARRAGAELGLPASTIASVLARLEQPACKIESLDGGTESNAYLINSGGRLFVWRLSNGRFGELSLARVVALTEQVRAVGVPAPLILAHHLSTSGDGEPDWTLEEWIKGHPFVPNRLIRRDALSIAAEIGHSLRRLHEIGTVGFGAVAAEHLTAPYPTLAEWLETQILDRCRTLPVLPTGALLLIEAACRFMGETYSGSPRLCHFDLHPWNFLVNKGRLSAIVDWNQPYGCDPAFDIASLHFWLGNNHLLDALLEAYAPDEREVFRRRVMAAVVCYSAFWLAEDFHKSIKAEDLERYLKWLTADDWVLSFKRDVIA